MPRKILVDDPSRERSDMQSILRVMERVAGSSKISSAKKKGYVERLKKLYRELEDDGYGAPRP